MNILKGERCSGKTDALIKLSNKTGANIIVHRFGMRKVVEEMAESLQLEIPKVYSIEDILYRNVDGVKEVLIDEIDLVLSVIFKHKKIRIVTGSEFDITHIKSKAHKPPIGITPKEIWILQRKVDLHDAIERYLDDGIKIPVKWIEEYNSYQN